MHSTGMQSLPLTVAAVLTAACLSGPSSHPSGTEATPATPPAAAAATAPASAQAAPPADTPIRVTIAELSAEPARFVGKRIVVTGRLVNEHPTYQRLILALHDEKRGRLAVRPWLRSSVSLPRQRPGQPDATPAPSQSQFLNQDVELTGTLARDDEADKPSASFIFIVSSARIVERPG